MPSRLRRQWIVLPVVGALGLATLFAVPSLVSKQLAAAAVEAGDHDHAAMSEAEMERWVQDWYSKHPEVGRSSVIAAVADTFFALPSPLIFNSDGNTATPVDTAKIMIGDQVRFQLQGTLAHTATSGTGPTDPQVGMIFDAPLNTTNPFFITPVFNTAGTFRFFCRPHVGSNMRGVIVVRTVVGVGPSDGAALGFTAGPAPNPSRGGIQFRFSLRDPGRVRAEILDIRGRRIATVVDQSFDAGSYAAAWNGHDDRGAQPAAGVYYLRLRVPGLEDTRRFALTR